MCLEKKVVQSVRVESVTATKAVSTTPVVTGEKNYNMAIEIMTAN